VLDKRKTSEDKRVILDHTARARRTSGNGRSAKWVGPPRGPGQGVGRRSEGWLDYRAPVNVIHIHVNLLMLDMMISMVAD